MIGLSLDELPTPAILVDLDVLERNVRRMAARAQAAGVRLRPHAKAHKSVAIGGMQRAAGASGLTLAKTSEAEVFVTAGFDDLFLAYPGGGRDKGRRLLALSHRARIAVGVDSAEGGQTPAGGFRDPGLKLDVLVQMEGFTNHL